MKEKLTLITSQDVKEKLVRLEPRESYVASIASKLGQIVYGQEEACLAVARRVAIFDSCLANTRRPGAIEYFLGPSGTGKTEMARALSDYMFKDPNSPRLKIIDCSEFSEPHTVMRLTGAPPSYVGYADEPLFTPAFLNNRNIVVFDEIEKAHPEFWRHLLPIMEEGRLRIRHQTGHYAAEEKELSFALSFIIFTSNVGSMEIEKCRKGVKDIGFRHTDEKRDIKAAGFEALKKHFQFMPEFLGRIDDIVCFNALEPKHYEKIFWKFIHQMNEDMGGYSNKPPYVAVTAEFRDWVLSKLSHEFGAREIRHLIDTELKSRLANLLEEYDLYGEAVVADYDNGEISFYTTHEPQEPKTNIIPFPVKEEVKDDPGEAPSVNA